ncbi:MAG: glycosyltransferase family 39 protein [Planctomycetaceae bacterium]
MNQISQSNIRPTRRVLEAAVILCAVFAIQFTSGAYHRDFAAHADEPAHFVTGVMVRDYLVTSPGSSPLQFAEEYYLCYPKVGIGHWPPAFYALQGIWYSLVGVSKTSATSLIGLISAGTAWCLYRRLSRRHGTAIAWLTIVVFLGQPLVRSHSILIMSDMAVCLGTLSAMFAFSDFLESPGRKHAASFVLWSSFSVLTKPSAMALAVFVPICVLVTRQTTVAKNWRLWAAGAAVGGLTAPWYLWTWAQGMGLHTHGSISRMVGASLRSGRRYHASDALVSAASWWLVVVSVLGIVSLIVPRWRKTAFRDAGEIDAMAAIALCCGTILFLFAAPIISAPRYFLPFLAGMMILYARGLETLLCRMPGPKPFVWTVISCLAALAVVTAPGRVPTPVTGYAVAAESFGDPDRERVTLISSNPRGDGAFVAERLLRDRHRSEFVLRASKVLEQSNWSGGRYRVRFSTYDQLSEYLNSVPVHFIVIDDFGHRSDAKLTHHELLKELLVGSPEQFPLIAGFPVDFQGRRHEDAIRVYENRSARGRHPVHIELDMNSSLGRSLQLESHDNDNPRQ